MVRGAFLAALAAGIGACVFVGCTLALPLDGLTGGEAGAGESGGGQDGSESGSGASSGGDGAGSGGDVVTAGDGARDVVAPACEAGLVPCGGACVDPQSDGANCGRCAHDCGGGGCTMGACQPFTIASGLNTPRDISVSGGNVYWTDHSASGDVSVCPVTGCTGMPQQLATGLQLASGIAVSGSALVFGCYGSTPPEGGANLGAGAFECDTSGCGGMGPAALTSGPGAIVGVATDGVNAYWNDASLSQVFSCAIGGCGGNPTQIAAGIGTPWYGITLDATNVYFAGRSDGNVYACPKAGCMGGTATPLVTGLTGPFGLAVDATDVYFTEFDPNNLSTPGPVAKCALTGCASPTIVAAAQATPVGIAVDGSGVYWANQAAGNATAGTVAYCPKSGCPASGPTTLASGRNGPFLVALDADFVYWTETTGGNVMRVAKP
jgi:hypothetical protein